MDLTKSYFIGVPREAVWRALTDPAVIDAWGGGPAEIRAEPGAAFTFWGGDIYGTMPSLIVGANDDTGRGRWIPSTSVDEYSATLATWFGVSATNLPVVLPNIGRFAKPNLGFMG